MNAIKPLRIWLERSVSPTLSEILHSDYFELTDGPEHADVIIYERDDPDYVSQTPEFQKWSHKCVIIGEHDRPSYFLPGCYASNQRGLLSKGRIQTMSYIVSQRTVPNPFIKDITDVEPRRYLYSFKGGSTSWARKKLFKLGLKGDDILVEEANQYLHWNYEESYETKKQALQKEYADTLQQSYFFLCPRGAGVSSIRLFEVMQAGRVPVIIADEWVPIEGLPWDEFSITIRESSLAEMDSIIRAKKDVAVVFGKKAREVWLQYCAPGAEGFMLAKSLRSVQANRNEAREKLIRSVFPLLRLKDTIKGKGFAFAKRLVLLAYTLMGKKFPYSLNRPEEEQSKKK